MGILSASKLVDSSPLLLTCVKEQSKADDIKKVVVELDSLSRWKTLAEEKSLLQNIIEINDLSGFVKEAEINEMRAKSEIKAEASLYSEKSGELRKNVEEGLTESEYKIESIRNFLMSESKDLTGPEAKRDDTDDPVNYEGEKIELNDDEKRVLNTIFSRMTWEAYFGRSLDKTDRRFLNTIKKIKIVFWHYRRSIVARPSVRAEMIHLEQTLRNRRYIEALQMSIKLFKDDERTFELVANSIKE